MTERDVGSPQVAALRDHIDRKLAAAVLEMSPFPHLIVEEFFPADVYAGVLRHNPFRDRPGEEWLPREASANVTTRTPYADRKQVDLRRERPDVPAESLAFWQTIRACFLADHWFQRRIVAAYEEYFALRFGDLVKDHDFYSLLSTELFLQRHERGFFIGPHTDLATRVFTCIFSFADRPGFEAYGTQLLAHRDRLVRCFGNDHHARDEFVVRKLAPYKPNNAFLFFKTRQSFHAVPVIDTDLPNDRYGMQFQFHEPPGGVFRDLSTPNLMQFRREPR